MAGCNPESTNTSFPVTVALLSCIYNLLVAVSCSYLPDDPLYIGLSISLYAWAGSVLSILGMVGIVTKRPTLITSFAHFLLLDTLVSALARLLVLQFFLDSYSDTALCSDEPTWSPSSFRHDIVTSVHWQKQTLWESTRGQRCKIAVDAVQFVLLALVVCLTAAQGSLAMTMRRYGKAMERPKVVVEVVEVRRSRSLGRDPEKAALEL